MASIKFLDEDAHKDLNDIPVERWSRHVFSTTSESNMLLNNMCERFNVVLKGARDKPIMTCMEWIRRYVMKRCFEKWEMTNKEKGRFMPYVKKVFDGFEVQARYAEVLNSQLDVYDTEGTSLL